MPVFLLLMPSSSYIGRFAPSPTGALHFGSLVAAVGSFLEARSRQGKWLLRMDDLDRLREEKGAADQILHTLEVFGLYWDGEVLYQSGRDEAYQAALDYLTANKLAYPCGCSRRDIRNQAITHGDEGPIYPGTCRHGLPQGKHARSWRFSVPDEVSCFKDALQGKVCQQVSQEVGDFVIRRADQLFAYQLAVVVDDADQGITHIVRGADLMASTPRQLLLQKSLRLPKPEYSHLPLAMDAAGKKLSKQNHAKPVDPQKPIPALLQALQFLGQETPLEAPVSLPDLWQWAIENWDIKSLKKTICYS